MKSLLYAAPLLLGSTLLALPSTVSGVWEGTIHYDDLAIHFPIEFSGQGSQAKASFFNGDERVTSTSGKIDGNIVSFRFDHYATQLDGTLEDGVFKGTYGNRVKGLHEIEARPQAPRQTSGQAPNIAGVWDIPTESPKGEHAWRLIVRQSPEQVSAAILRVDGDTGAITGLYRDGKFLLQHFDGARAYVLQILPQADGTLALNLRGAKGPAKDYVAVRQAEASAKGIAAPTDPTEHTRMKDPSQRFEFSFPDVDGNAVSSADARFRNKVLIVNVTGSWCPNCHDEAPYLVELYQRYRALGLEIVALDFEEAEQLADKTRLRAFLKKYGIEYTYLVAGETKDLNAKLPQVDNLNSWPTTFFVGRDGRVRAVHAGFAGKASGEFYDQLRKEVSGTVERLLAENPSPTETASEIRATLLAERIPNAKFASEAKARF